MKEAHQNVIALNLMIQDNATFMNSWYIQGQGKRDNTSKLRSCWPCVCGGEDDARGRTLFHTFQRKGSGAHFLAGSQHTNCSACIQWYVWRGCGQQVTYIHHGRECHGYLWAGFVQGWNDHIKNIFNDFEVWIYLGFNGTKPPRMTAAHIICSLNGVCLLNINLGEIPEHMNVYFAGLL